MADIFVQVRTQIGNGGTVLAVVPIPDTAIPIIQAVEGGGTNPEVALAFLQRLLALGRPFYIQAYEALNEATEQATITAAREQARTDAETALG